MMNRCAVELICLVALVYEECRLLGFYAMWLV
jgi:hypothetical protein